MDFFTDLDHIFDAQIIKANASYNEMTSWVGKAFAYLVWYCVTWSGQGVKAIARYKIDPIAKTVLRALGFWCFIVLPMFAWLIFNTGAWILSIICTIVLCLIRCKPQ